MATRVTGKHAQHLHSIVSTGAVLTTPLAKWLGKAFGPVCQVSMSGGTELCGAFLHGTLSLPSFPGELAVKGLGLDVAVFSSDGTPVPDGESGELVCRKPFPNMPLMLWNDPGRKRYRDSYFSKFPSKPAPPSIVSPSRMFTILTHLYQMSGRTGTLSR